MCPDFPLNPEDTDYWLVKNDYSNNTERKSFSLEIRKCNALTIKCKTQKEIQDFLANVYFTVYYTEETTELID